MYLTYTNIILFYDIILYEQNRYNGNRLSDIR